MIYLYNFSILTTIRLTQHL